MLDGELQNKHDAWATAINTRERQPRNLPKFTRADLELNSGYRNPHHNKYHSGGNAVHGLHQYGLALDVEGRDVDGIAGIDKQKMRDAAEAATPPARETFLYDNTDHVHADWREASWPR